MLIFALTTILFFALAMGLFFAWRASHNLAACSPQGAFVTVEGCRLHYRRQGRGLPVVLLHGSDGFLNDYDRLLESPDAGVEYIVFDRPGHGWSDAPLCDGGTLPTQARLLHAALRQLGVRRPLLAGHSWSAALCLYYALEYPRSVSGVTLFSPWSCPTSDPPPRLLYAARLLGNGAAYGLLTLTPLKYLLLRYNLRLAFAPDAVPPDYERQAMALWQRTPRMVGVFLQENADAWARFPDLLRRYAQMTLPVVIVTGNRDGVVHAESQAGCLMRELPHAELVVVSGAGHEIPHTQPQAALAAIKRGLELASIRGSVEADVSDAMAPASASPTESGNHILQQARTLVFRYGWNATAYQILTPAIKHWFASDGEAVVGYLTRFRTRVAAGAPICDETRLANVADAFEREAAQTGETVCWFAATTRLRNALDDRFPHATLVVGAQPVWNPANWTAILKANASLRAQINRARNKGLTASEWTRERAAASPDLQRCLDEWLTQHTFPTLHFLTEPVTLDRLTDRRIFAAESSGAVVGFLIITPVPSQQGWLAEQIARGYAAPNGTVELLIDTVMRSLAAEGSLYVTLGMAPLSRRGQIGGTSTSARFTVKLLMRWARRHGGRFYNFEGLDTFKAKLKPDRWEPLLAISNERRFSLRTLLAIAAAFSDGPLLLTIGRALFTAAQQEARWLQQKLRSHAPSP